MSLALSLQLGAQTCYLTCLIIGYVLFLVISAIPPVNILINYRPTYYTAIELSCYTSSTRRSVRTLEKTNKQTNTEFSHYCAENTYSLQGRAYSISTHVLLRMA